jgi:hypothetical protein
MRQTPVLVSVLLVSAVLASTAGCASVRAGQARADALRKQLDEQRFAKPMEEVWPEARRLLAERGFPLAGEDAKAVGQAEMGLGDRLFSPARETHPYGEDTGLLQKLGMLGGKKSGGGPTGLSLDTGWRRTRDRYHVDALQDERGVRVVYLRITENDTEHREEAPVRDLELELELLQRLDAEAAARMESGLDAASAAR